MVSFWCGYPWLHRDNCDNWDNPLSFKAIVSLKGKTSNSYGYIGNSDIECRLFTEKIEKFFLTSTGSKFQSKTNIAQLITDTVTH